MKTKRLFLVIGYLSFVVGIAQAQSIRSLVNGGNDLYEEKKFADAEVNYKKALEKDITTVPGHFNLGNSLYRQNKYEESLKSYQDAIEKAETKSAKAQSYYNLGNAHLKANKYEDAVKSFVESLKLNASDQDAKYNLSYALEKLKQQQEEQKNQKKSDKNQDKDKQDQNKQDENKKEQGKQDQSKQEQQDQQQQNQNQQQQPQQKQDKQMSKADAERILEVLKNNEKDVQKKLRQRVAGRPKSEKDW